MSRATSKQTSAGAASSKQQAVYNMKRVRTIASFYQVASNQESNEIIQNVQIGTNLDENENNQESLDVGTAQNNTESIDSWDAIFEEAKDFCLKHNIVVPDMSAEIVRRGCSRGRRGQLVTYYEHLHHEIFNVVLDQVIVEFNNRFAERSTQLLRCVACIDPSNSFANYDEDKLVELAQIYVDDFTEYDCIVLKDQLDTFITEGREDSSFLSCCDLGNLAMKMVKTDRHTVFPLVYRLIELALILPVATATVERAFSAMKIIKTDLRNKMGDEWMSHCMICYIERDIFASIEDRQIIEHYQAMRTRREQIPKTRNISIVDESNLSN